MSVLTPASIEDGVLVGRRLAGQYDVERLIAIGGMGEVYRARDTHRSQHIALKILKLGQRDNPRAHQRFQREGELMARLEHPHTPRVFDRGQLADGRPWIAMEFVDGELLSHLLDERGALPPDHAVLIASQVARAVDAAHRIGVLHRDIKPDNVLVTWDELGEPFAWILDFGIAWDQDADRLTAPGRVCGTAEYMAPEQARGESLDARCDVYALGVMTWELLAGRPPYRDTNPVRVALMHQLDPIPPLPPHIDARLQSAVHRAMAKNADERTATATAFAESLRHALLDEPAPRRPWPLIAGAAAAAVCLAALGLWATL